MTAPDLLHRIHYRLWFQDHPCAASVRIIIRNVMPVFSIIPDVVQGNRKQALFPALPKILSPRGERKKCGKKRKDFK